MEHLTVKAVASATDLGEFTAIAATYDVDRVKDQIAPGAFERTIARWQASGKNLPVHWNHSGAAKDIIGAIDPAAMREIPDEGLYVEGKLDLQYSEVAREAWRSMKNNAVSLSFGYLATKARRRKDGIQDLLEIDLFEITVAPGPANPKTRFLSLKAVAEHGVPTDVELRHRWAELKASVPRRHSAAQPSREFDRHRLDTLMDGVPRHDPAPAAPSAAELRREWDRLRLELLTDDLPVPAPEPVPVVPTDTELREQAKALGLPVPPPRRHPDYTAVRAQARREMLTLFEQADGR